MKNIFVSSTFRDMQAERDLIQKEVLPQLKSKAKAYGENINMIDLRWGVDTSELESEEGSMKVMSVCLDEVERSRPHMLIFLGERYGSIIDPSITERVIARKDSQFKLDDYAISITAMEVEFGALSEQFDSLENCVVCMRSFVPESIANETERAIYQAEDAERKAKQQAFKEKVLKKVQGRVIEYTCDWDEQKKQLVNFKTTDGLALSEKLIATYETMFEKEWQMYSALSWEEKEQLAVDALQESKLRTFSGREALISHYYESVVNESGALILQGDVGSGKTSIMCKLMEKLTQDGKKVFRFAAGNSSMSETAMQLVQQLVYYLETVLGEEHFCGVKEKEIIQGEQAATDKYSDWIEHLDMLAASLGDEEKIYIVADALDQMYLDESVRTLDFVLPNEKLRYVMSCTSDFEIPDEEKVYQLVTEQVPLLDISDAKDVIEGILTASSRNVYKDIENSILAKQSANNPLYISMLIQRLNMMGFDELYSAWTEEDIIRHGMEVIKNMPDTALNAAVFMLDEAIARLETECAGLKDVVNLIGVSRGGLRESDILSITKEMGHPVNQLDISRLIHYLDTFFVIHKDGQIDFTHKVIRRGVYSKADHEVYIKAIAERIKMLGPEDDFRKKEGMYYARMTKDAKLAEMMFIYASETEDPVVYDAIKAEGLADKGDFYCRYMAQMKGMEEFFSFHWDTLFDLKREETNLKERVGLCYAECLVKWVDDNPTPKNLRYLLHGYCNKGLILENRGEPEAALECLKKAVKVGEFLYHSKRDAESAIELCDCYDELGKMHYAKDEIEEALVYYEKALHIRENADEENSDTESKQELSKSYYYMGESLCELGLKENNEEYLERGFAYFFKDKEISEKLYEEEPSYVNLKNIAVLYMSMGQIYHAKHNEEEAVSYHEKAIKAWEAVYDVKRTIGNLRMIGSCLFLVADVYGKQKKLEVATERYIRALPIFEKVHKAKQNHESLEEVKWVNRELARALRAQGKKTEAISYFKKAFNMTEQIHKGKKSLETLMEVADIYAEIKDLLKELKKEEEQRNLFRKTLEMIDFTDEIALTNKSASLIEDIVYIVDPGEMRGEAKAVGFYEKILGWVLALEEHLQLKEYDNLELLENCYQNIAIAHADQRNIEKARLYYAKYDEILKKKYQKEPNAFDGFLRVIAGTALGFIELVTKIRNWGASDSKKHKMKWAQISKTQSESGEYCTQANSYMDRKEYEKAEECYRISLALGEEVCSMTSRVIYLKELATAYSNLAYALQVNSKIKEAYEMYKKGLAVREQIVGKKAGVEELKQLAVSNSNIGRLLQDELRKRVESSRYKSELDINEAPVYFEAALNARETVYKKTGKQQDLEALSKAYYELGYILKKFGKKEASYAYYMRYLETKEELHEKQQSQQSLKELAICYGNVGYALQQMDRAEEGIGYSQKSLKLEEELYMSSVSLESMESLSASYYNFARALMRLKKEEVAMETYKKCVDMAEDFYHANPDARTYAIFAKRCDEIGGILLGNGQVEAALACYEKIVSISEERCDTDPKNKEFRDNFENNITFIGAVLRKNGKYKDALQYYQKFLLRAENAYKDESTSNNLRKIFYAQMLIGDTYDETCEWDTALHWYDKTMNTIDRAIELKTGPVIRRFKGEVLGKCSKLFLQNGNLQEAERYANEAYILLKTVMPENKDAREGFLQALTMLIRCNMEKGQFENCESYFNEMTVCITSNHSMQNISKHLLQQIRLWELKGDFYKAQSKIAEAKDAYATGYKQVTDALFFAVTDELKKIKTVLERKIAAL